MRRKIARFEKIAHGWERRIEGKRDVSLGGGKKERSEECKEKESGRKHGWRRPRAGTDIRRCGETIWDTVAAIRDGDEVRGREGRGARV